MMTKKLPPASATVFHGDAQGQNLVESYTEIKEIILSMMESGAQLAAYADASDSFLICRILGLDITRDAMFLGYDASSPLVNALQKSKSVCYVGQHEKLKIQFIGSLPHPVEYRGQAALQ